MQRMILKGKIERKRGNGRKRLGDPIAEMGADRDAWRLLYFVTIK